MSSTSVEGSVAELQRHVAALWARINLLSNAGGQVIVTTGPVTSVGAKAAGSSVLASGITQFDFRNGLSAVLDGTSEIDVALGNLIANWANSGAFDIYTVGGIGIGTVTTPLDITIGSIGATSALFGVRQDGTSHQFPMVFSQHSTTNPSGQGASLIMAKSKGSYGTPSAVSTGNFIGSLQFAGYDGADYELAAALVCFVDGTSGSNDMPGRLVFYTTPDGSTALSEAVRISNDQSARFSGSIFVGGTSAPAASTLQEWSSTTKGLKGPNMTVAQRDAISSPATGLRVYTTDANNNDFYDGTAWRQVDSSDGNQYATVSTTDATVTTLATITCAASTTTQIEARVSARRTGGSSGTAEDGAAYVRRAAIKNVGGTATLIGAVGTDFTAEDQAAWDATIDVTGATARVRVTGAANNNIDWKAQVRTLTVT